MYDVVFIQYFISGFYNRILEIDDCTWLQKDMLPVPLSTRVYKLFSASDQGDWKPSSI